MFSGAEIERGTAVTTKRNRQTRVGIMTLAVALTAGCSSKGQDADSRPARAATSASTQYVILHKDEIAMALPTPDAVPPGWEKSGKLRLYNESSESTRLAFGHIGYRAPDLDGGVGFSISSYPDAADAMAGFSELKTDYGDTALPTSITGADQAFAGSGCITEHVCSASIVVRTGALVLMVNINSDADEAPDPKVLNSVTRMHVARARQAERGETPTAKAS